MQLTESKKRGTMSDEQEMEEGGDDSSPGPAKSDGPGYRPLLVVIGFVVIAVVVAVAFAQIQDGGNGSTASVSSGKGTVQVGYFVTGSATSADITYNTPTGTGQQSGVDVPLNLKSQAGAEPPGGSGIHYTMTSGSFVYLSAQNKGDGDVTCRIDVDGVTVSENTSSGEFAIATCQGSA